MLWKNFPFFSRFIFFIAAPLLLLVLTLFIFIWSNSPPVSGELRVSGTNASASIYRTEGAMPRIEAISDHDAYFALGLLHAQERLWEMEIARRTGAGRLSEVFGKDAYASDLLVRNLNLYANAKNIWRHLDAKNKVFLQAYVNGVNAGINEKRMLPIEYYINGFQPEPWEPADSLVLLQLIAWNFSGNASDELRRLFLVNKYGVSVSSKLMPGVQSEVAGALNDRKNTTQKENFKETIKFPYQDALQNSIARRGWVISRGEVFAGAPILASDVLPPTSLPVSWFFSEIKSSTMRIAGGTLPGLPIFFLGRNDKIAWTLTGANVDTQDLVLEEVNPLNRNQYKVGDMYADMEISRGTIQLKKEFLRPASRPKDIIVRRTRNGAVISDMPGISDGKVLSLRWTGDDDTGGTFAGLMGMNQASSWNEFDSALSTYVAPVYNFLYSDVDGNIAYLAPGRYPIRSLGDGKMPVFGGGIRPLWEGFSDYAMIPRMLNPPGGVLAIENNALSPMHSWRSGGAVGSGAHDLPGIGIAAKDTVDVGRISLEEVFALQNHYAPELASVSTLLKMRSVQPSSVQQHAVLRAIKQWDGRLLDEGMAPAVYIAWRSHLRQLILNGLHTESLVQEPSDAYLIDGALAEHLMEVGGEQWCNVAKHPKYASCNVLLDNTLADALMELTALIGADESDWSLAALCKVTRHREEDNVGQFSAPKQLVSVLGSELGTRMHDFMVACRNQYRPAGVFSKWFDARLGSTTVPRWIVDFGSEMAHMPQHANSSVGASLSGIHIGQIPVAHHSSENRLSILPLTKVNR